MTKINGRINERFNGQMGIMADHLTEDNPFHLNQRFIRAHPR